MDYTPEGIKQIKYDNAISAVFSIDKRLKKISRNLTLLTLLPIVYMAYTIHHKKGE